MRNLLIDNLTISASPVDILTKLQQSLTNGKLSYFYDMGDNIKVQCPVHNDGKERRGSCYINITNDKAAYMCAHCFTCGLSCSFEQFVAYCKDISLDAAKRWLIQNFDALSGTNRFNLSSIVLNKPVAKKIISIDGMKSYHPYMTKRKLTKEVIEQFDVKFDPRTNCIVFPVKDKNGNIIFLTRRSVAGKQFIIDKGADKSNVYGIDQVYKKDCQTVYICESQINALTLWGYGLNAIATFGCGCPDDQIAVINNLPVLKYVIAFDNDEAGIKGALKLCKHIDSTKFVEVLQYNDARDINDLSKVEFDQLKSVDRSTFINKFANHSN